LTVVAEVHAGGETENSLCLPLEGENLLPCLRIPHFHRPVKARAGESLAVAAEGHAGDDGGVALEGGGDPAGLCVPHFHPAGQWLALEKILAGLCLLKDEILQGEILDGTLEEIRAESPG